MVLLNKIKNKKMEHIEILFKLLFRDRFLQI